MTKADLVEEISKRSRLSKSENARIVDEILNAISRALSEGHHIEIRGFGTFKVRSRRSRRARNPRTGAEVSVPAKLVPVFKPSNQLKALVRADEGGDSSVESTHEHGD
jgi:integration host factor subunit beta